MNKKVYSIIKFSICIESLKNVRIESSERTCGKFLIIIFIKLVNKRQAEKEAQVIKRKDR